MLGLKYSCKPFLGCINQNSTGWSNVNFNQFISTRLTEFRIAKQININYILGDLIRSKESLP